MLVASNMPRSQTARVRQHGTPTTPSPPSDFFTPSRPSLFPDLAQMRLALASHSKSEPIPDIRGMLTKNPRFSKLNLEINKAYVVMARQFQDIYDPSRKLSPSWYAFAPFASRQAGNSIRMAEQMTARLDSDNKVASLSKDQEEALLAEFPNPEEREQAAHALALLGPNRQSDGTAEPYGILGDIKHLVVAARRLQDLTKNQKGPMRERAARLARTARNMLEEGNKAIVSEIGVAGQDYLTFRQGKTPTPAEVLENFTVDGTPADPAQAKRVFQEMKTIVESNAPLRTDWDKGYSPEEFDRSNFLVAGFAAYEAARIEPNKNLKNRWIEQAGTLIAFREQRDTVQPAFDRDGATDEVSRKAVMQLGTPWVEVPTNDQDWSFKRYAQEKLPPADDSKWTPRAAEYNWGDFTTRWGAILDFFGQVFHNPDSLWPMPDPNPQVPLLEQNYSKLG